MQISNRMLLVLATASGLATIGLVWATPTVSPIRVLAADGRIELGTPLVVGSNLKSVTVSFKDFSDAKNLVPESMGALVDSRHCLMALEAGKKLTLDHVLPGKRAAAGKGKAKGDVERYLRLSGLLAEDAGIRAIAVNSDALASVGYALEPGDYVDIVFPAETPEGGLTFPHLKVLAVGGRTEGGWVTGGKHEERNNTITLAVPKDEAGSLAAQFAFAGTAKPRTVLYPRNPGE